ncbi:type IV toxin-antitoxin system AbiEi family antitoxin domain-containing protein [Sphingomonas crocodyli]|uniref:Transcriptional regulator n=1 Tax=Sphingomonas crocodyli TaxID=1979270 RepID=A0A437LYC3_9SPHN|nr:type IV toxin-antitoxin system AbiEi family antitoxin domain-containing protein [Sphingomonas crocodyli]RVT90410.1 transcriptional regulator [Sphingomonas crocodyli]
MSSTPRKTNNAKGTQSKRALILLDRHGIMRTRELVAGGVAATTLSRMEKDGIIQRLSRGLYQRSDAATDINHDLAEAAKRVPKGVICLTSALAFHELTDQIPHRIWLAIGAKDWQPSDNGPSLRIIRLTQTLLQRDIQTHMIDGVPVRIFNIPRTLVDCFRFRKSVGLSVAVEALRDALKTRRTTAAEIADRAHQSGSWTIIRPYLEAYTIDG